MPNDVKNSVRRRRNQLALSQAELARRAGISRQALSALETGQTSPSGPVLLRLARALGCRVESLFWLDDGAEQILDAELVRDEASSPMQDAANSDPIPERVRVALGWLAGRWVAHPLGDTGHGGMVAADGSTCAGTDVPTDVAAEIADRVAVEPWVPDLERLRDRGLLVAGCDPALALLGDRIAGRYPQSRTRWIHAPSMRSLELLKRDQVHIAGVHLHDRARDEFNVPFVERHVGAALVINLARWDEGLVVSAGNPLQIHSVEDLQRSDVRLINRPEGAGARQLLEHCLEDAGVESSAVARWSQTAPSHEAVARAVAMGTADVGVATRGSAIAFGLDFVPLAAERFDLVVPAERVGETRIQRLLDTIDSAAFRRELESLGGYETPETGHVIAETKGAA